MLLVVAFAQFVACGGGSGSSGSSRTAPAITSADSTTFAVGAAGTFTVTSTGTPTPALAITGALPSGVTFNTSTAVLSGTPAVGSSGTYPLTITASNGVSPDATQSFTLTIPNYLMGGSIQGIPASITGVVTTFAGIAGVAGSVDATGAAASFRNPFGITTDGANLYVTDMTNYTIRKIVIATGVVTTLAGTAGVTGSTDGTGPAASFGFLAAITTDGTNLYVADYSNQTIRKIVIATGVVTTLAGTAGVTGSTDGTGAAASFSGPAGITTDGTNLYVGEEGNSTIRKIVIATGVVTTMAGTAGVTGSTDGTGAVARFFGPDGITTDGINLYVAEYLNNTIRKIVIATGVVTTLAGSPPPTLPGSVDGTGVAASFNSPLGITTDGTNLYVTEQTGNVVRKVVTATGVVTTIAGAAGAPAGSADGTGGAAHFFRPVGVTTDGTNLFVADFSNDTIREIK